MLRNSWAEPDPGPDRKCRLPEATHRTQLTGNCEHSKHTALMLMLYDVRAATPSRARHKYRYRYHYISRLITRPNVWMWDDARMCESTMSEQRVGQQEHSVLCLCWANMDVVLMQSNLRDVNFPQSPVINPITNTRHKMCTSSLINRCSLRNLQLQNLFKYSASLI